MSEDDGRELTFETAVGQERWLLPRYTTEQVLRLPAVMDLVDAARAWDMGKSQAYALAKRGATPFRVVRLGYPAAGTGESRGDYKVRLADLLESLGLPVTDLVQGFGHGGPPAA